MLEEIKLIQPAVYVYSVFAIAHFSVAFQNFSDLNYVSRTHNNNYVAIFAIRFCNFGSLFK